MKLYIWFRKHRATVNSVLITLFTSLAVNTVSGTQGNLFKDYAKVAAQIFEFRSLSGFLTIASLAVLVVFNLAYVIAGRCLNRQSFSREFPAFMKQNTSPQLADSLGNGCLSWGEGKTVEICNDIIFGWNPKNILIEGYDDVQYGFYAAEEQERKFGKKSYYFNTEDYEQFRDSEAFRKVIRKGNNLPRFMLVRCAKNYDRHERKLLLDLERTEWSQTSYVWDRFGKSAGNEVDSRSLMGEYSGGVRSGDESDPYLPHSFCMHLLIETRDGKVILALISASKRNDNPGTWAATLGEQLDLEDFTDGMSFHDNFVQRWMQRAFREEYNMDDTLYYECVDESSLRCLSVDFESDRYNFALFCTVRLRYTFEAFCGKITTLLSTEEASKLKAVSLDDIPAILMTYADSERRKEYHPSTYLRLLLFYVHKYGYSKAEKKLLEMKQ